MNEHYMKVSRIAKQLLYKYLKRNNISILNCYFSSFFQYYIEINKIRVFSHHFSNHKIEGLTIIDDYGISFSYERDNSKEKQNFTLCHNWLQKKI